MANISSIEFYLRKSVLGIDSTFTLNVYAINASYSIDPDVGSLLATKDLSDSSLTQSFQWITFTFDSPFEVSDTGYLGIAITSDGSAFAKTRLRFGLATDHSDAPQDPVDGSEQFYQGTIGGSWSDDNTQGIMYRVNSDEGVLNSSTTYDSNEINLSSDLGLRSYVSPSVSVPDKPTTPVPENEQIQIPGGIEIPLGWTDPGEGEANEADTFDVWFGTDLTGPSTKVASAIASTSWTVPSNINSLIGQQGGEYLNQAQTYQWRVDATNDAGTTTGDVWEFDTSLILGLGAPINPTPETEATGSSVHLSSVSYENGGGASAYRMYIRPSGGTYQLIKEFNSSGVAWGTSDTVPLAYFGLGPSTTYEWYVTATNGSFGVLDSLDGSTWEFTTRAYTGTGADAYYPVRDSLTLTRKLVAAANHKIWYED